MFTQLIEEYEHTLSSVIGVQTVPEDETHRYGIIDPLEKEGRRYQVTQFVEKPAPGDGTFKLSNYGALRVNTRNIPLPRRTAYWCRR